MKEVEVLSTSFEQQALSSEDALKVWEEIVEGVVTSAISDGVGTNDLVEEFHGTPAASAGVVGTADEYQQEVSKPKRAWSSGGCVGEILIDRQMGPAHTFQVCLGLKSTLNSEIFSIDHSNAGTTVRCTVPNSASLIGALDQFTGISSWALIAV